MKIKDLMLISRNLLGDKYQYTFVFIRKSKRKQCFIIFYLLYSVAVILLVHVNIINSELCNNESTLFAKEVEQLNHSHMNRIILNNVKLLLYKYNQCIIVLKCFVDILINMKRKIKDFLLRKNM